MPNYYIEGLFATLKGVKNKQKTGTYPVNCIEPFAKTIWAESPLAALEFATLALEGGEWTETPTISLVTEEQRMRSAHQPEFPGLSNSSPKHGARK